MSTTYETPCVSVVLYEFILVSLKWWTAEEFLHTSDFVHMRHAGQGGQVIDLFVTFGGGGGARLVRVNNVKLLFCATSWDHICMVHKSECQNLKCITAWRQSLSLKISIFWIPYFIFSTLCNRNEHLKLFKPETRVMKAGSVYNNSSF